MRVRVEELVQPRRIGDIGADRRPRNGRGLSVDVASIVPLSTLLPEAVLTEPFKRIGSETTMLFASTRSAPVSTVVPDTVEPRAPLAVMFNNPRFQALNTDGSDRQNHAGRT